MKKEKQFRSYFEDRYRKLRYYRLERKHKRQHKCSARRSSRKK